MNGRKGKVMVKTEGTAELVEQREEKSIFTIISIVTCITIKRGLSTVVSQCRDIELTKHTKTATYIFSNLLCRQLGKHFFTEQHCGAELEKTSRSSLMNQPHLWCHQRCG